MANGAPFPQRDLILIATFGVIIVTLVGQGLMLPSVIRWLGLAHEGRAEQRRQRESNRPEDKGGLLADYGLTDEQGNEISLTPRRGRAVTYIGHDLAAIVHDPVFLDQPAMLDGVGSAARFALENERLQAQLRAQLAELRESRARVVQAGDEERRRLERDLHDGAQQRLLGLGMALQLLRSRVDGDGEAGALVQESEHELQLALAELR